MSSTASYAAQSDPEFNRHFRRRWIEPHPPHQVTAMPLSPMESPEMATLLRWRDEWRGRKRDAELRSTAP